MSGEKKSEQATSAAALAFDPDADAAPRVVAAGRGALAEAIVSTARAHNRHIVVNQELAELLQTLPVGPPIPETLFRSVAAVFALVYDLRDRARSSVRKPRTPFEARRQETDRV